MRVKIAAVGLWALHAAGLAFILAGCGEAPNETDEAFLESVRASNVVGETGTPTLPGAGEDPAKAPSIQLETTELDVGVIANDRPHHTRLNFTNKGGMALRISNITSSCPCTEGTVTLDNAVVAPGAAGWIDITIHPDRLLGFRTRKVLTVTSTDPVNSVIEVGVTTAIDPEYELSPELLEVGEIEKGATFERRVRFRQIQDAPISVLNFEMATDGSKAATVPGIAVAIADIPEAEWQAAGKREYDLIFQFGPDLPAGEFKRSAFLYTDIPRFGRQRIGITGTVKAPYEVTPLYPERALLALVPGTGYAQARFEFVADDLVTLKDLAPEDPRLTAAIEDGSEPGRAVLLVTLPNAASEAPMDTIVRLNVEVGGVAYSELVGVQYVVGRAAL